MAAGKRCPFALHAWLGDGERGLRGAGGSPGPAVPFCAQWGSSTAPMSAPQPSLCRPAAPTGAPASAKMLFAPGRRGHQKLVRGAGDPGAVAQLESGRFAGHTPACPGKGPACRSVCLRVLLRFGPVALSLRCPGGRDRSEVTVQPSWKLNRTTGSKTLVNMLCIPRIRLLVTLKLNSNAILKYIIC